jgi:hypothetical protein
MNLLSQKPANNFYSSDARRSSTGQMSFDFLAAFCVHSVESVEKGAGLE